MHRTIASLPLLAAMAVGCGDPVIHRDATLDHSTLDAFDAPFDAGRDALDAWFDAHVSEPPMCHTPADCPGVDTSCAMRSCTEGQCVSHPVPIGTALTAREQVQGDCQLLACDGAGAVRGHADDTDLPDDHNDCTTDRCLGGTEQYVQRAAHAPCATGVCDGLGVCLRCLDDTDCAPGDHCVHVRCITPGCGNGTRERGEQCDDGNRTPGDGCSATCMLEARVVAESEPNDTDALANASGGVDGFVAAIDPVGDHDWFSLDVTVPDSTVTLEVGDGLGGCPFFDSLLTLEGPAHLAIATDDNGGVSPCSRLVQPRLAVGTYHVEVRQLGDALIQDAYVLSIRVLPPTCGDAVVQPGEQCDDGNVISGDGCSATCQVESPHEREPNDTTATATPPWPAGTSWIGSIVPATDVDYFAFTVPGPGSRVVIDTHDVGSTATCAFDTTVSLIAPDGRSIASDVDTGPGLCGRVDGFTNAGASGLPAGTYYARVVSAGTVTASIAAYAVDVTVY